MLKECPTCKERKPPSGFHKNRTKPDGLDNECRRCKHIRESSKEARDAKRERDLMRLYGLTLADYEALAEMQGHVCAICGEPEKATNRFGELLPLSVDHDHDTGEVRGLLCSRCNKGIGALGDDVMGVLTAAIYLAGRGRE